MFTDLNSTLFNINMPTEQPREGSLLIAEPFLKEACFNHAVILLIDHGLKSASMGLALNKLTGYKLGEIVDEVHDDVDVPVFCGGPVGDDRMFYLHTLGNLFRDSVEVVPGLYIGGDYRQVIEYVNDGYPTQGLLRFYVGYSGWDPGQLEEEIEKNVWAVTRDVSPKRVLSTAEDTFWHREVRRLGDDYRGWQFHPMNPMCN